jgi:F-type H+-transporting ATPase subunit b
MIGWLETKRSGRSGIRGGKPPRTRGKGPAGLLFRALATGIPLGIFLLAAAHASGDGAEGGRDWFDFSWRMFNFIVLVGILFWLLAGKIRDFMTGRREGIRTALAEAVSAREAAEKKFREYSEKLEKATGEIAQIGEMIRSQGLAEKERIIEDARKAAEKMKEDTRARMEQEFSKGSRDLRIEAVRLSTEMAEEILKKQIRPEDHESMVKDYIEKGIGQA